jgi:hypothetical protein
MSQLRLDLNYSPKKQRSGYLTDRLIAERAEKFANELPHTKPPYLKRNWGGIGHSICSYQGKLKPSIGYFLIDLFTEHGSTVYDPLGGVGTIPFEARKQGRIGIASDLSPLAVSVCSSKLEPINELDISKSMKELSEWIRDHSQVNFDRVDTTFGLNGPLVNFFHPDTLHELVAAREFFKLRRSSGLLTSENFILTCLLHILHGNRPYALSRNSHPITPFKPTGEFIYKNVIEHLNRRLDSVIPYFLELQQTSPDGRAFLSSFENVTLESQVDSVITSPPFVDSFRFWSSNWMRMWMAGWEPEDFQSKPKDFLETKQKSSMNEYALFARCMSRIMKDQGLLILHLGVTRNRNMAHEISELIQEDFRIISIVQEDVARTETHGLSDKGKKTIQHAYLFARKN